MSNTAISLVGVKDKKELENLILSYPDSFFELSYNLKENEFKEYVPLLKGKISSLHALSPQRDFFPSFSSLDEKVLSYSKAEVLKDAKVASNLNAKCIVLHPGYLSSNLIPRDAKERLKLLEETTNKQFILRQRGAIATKDYHLSFSYKEAFYRMKNNLIELSKEVEELGVKLAIENLNPRAGYLFIHPDEIKELAKENLYFTLDIGHLWISTCLYELPFLKTLERILSYKRVINTHIHTNSSHIGDIESLEDSHNGFFNTSLPYMEAIKLIKESGALLTLETAKIRDEDIRVLLK